jgi:hypothetical protein
MIDISPGWAMQADISPEWLFVRLVYTRPAPDAAPPVAERVWSLAEQHQLCRFVLEIDPEVRLTSHLVSQLILLHKRSHKSEGVTRICGFTEDQYQVLRIMSLATRFPNYATREDAVLGRQ